MFRILIPVLLVWTAGECLCATPSKQSIKEIFIVTDVRRQYDELFPEIGSIILNGVVEAAGRELTADEKKRAEAFVTTTTARMKTEVAWETLEPILIPIYEEVFSQEEIDGMIAFYRSPPGQALVKKMPMAQQKASELILKSIEPKMKSVQDSIVKALPEILTRKTANKSPEPTPTAVTPPAKEGKAK